MIDSFWFLYIFFLLAFIFREMSLRKGNNAKSIVRRKEDKGSSLAIGLSLCFLLVGIPFFHFLQIGLVSNITVFEKLGFVIVLCGISLNFLSITTLGKFYTRTLRIETKQQLIKSGPYRLIRHPGYAAMIISFLGLSLASASTISIICTVILVSIVFTYRMHVEEQMLQETFGEEYVRYMQKTKKLIPYIY